MTFRRDQDRVGKRQSRTISRFRGINYGFSKVDQPETYARLSDFDCMYDQLKLRPGLRKNQNYGYEGDVQGMFPINVFMKDLVGVVIGGALTIYDIQDTVDGLERYYTWGEVKALFTWKELKGKTWKDLIRKAEK